MPFKECLRLDDDQSFTPIEEPGEQDHERARDSGGTSRRDLAFLKQCELFAKEQILSNDYSVGREEQSDKREQLHTLQELPASSDELRSNYCGAQGMRGCILRHARSIRANESGSNFATGWAIGWAVCRATACKL